MIQLKNLVKDYGTLRAVDHINFEINEGEILGFLGPNGAGKTTTIKMITGFLSPTKGNIEVGDLNVLDNPIEIKKMIGYLPEHNPLYTEMTVYDYLKFVADIRGLQNFKQRLKEVIEKCGLHGIVAKPISTLSKGYKQRVGLAQAILHDPEILILDEPTSGLDPNQIMEIRELIKELGKEKTLILCSHILQEVQAVCDRIIILNKGKVVADGSAEALQASFENRTRIILELTASRDEIQKMADDLTNMKVETVKEKGDFVEAVLEFDATIDRRADIFNYVKKKKWTLLEMHRINVSLEDVFRNLTIDNAAPRNLMHNKPETETKTEEGGTE
ncbi:MAG: ATP-binding cassette domain-containing protein [Candidatus Cloacimonetes bacterium]|nr:ATP-binding cassette domain-containing protein [Candidatus Cloacimonadota bacterium]MCF7815042.1 ATP-binding cassette domain-containing protein [Candidatus Cloacimonadota bacterium]MCF7868368.1 ATP-binding cassette domain-containing protein [Candidatus Cloacimonadota bacterium]MCF7883866.1 ATP-binding cassette domain-containing protein [Candidatus Cloacimonadota bacterium]